MSVLPTTIRRMGVATLIFAGIAAIGAVMAVVVASKPLLNLVESKHRRLDAIIADYEKMFGRLYAFVMNDLDEAGHVKPANARIFTAIAGNEMYIHAGDGADAWQSYRRTQGI